MIVNSLVYFLAVITRGDESVVLPVTESALCLYLCGGSWFSKPRDYFFYGILIMMDRQDILEGLFLLPTRKFEDARGYFMETYSMSALRDHIGERIFVQDNLSCSRKGVFRGMHAQLAPYAQSKLVRVLHGAIVDYVLDVDPESATFGRWNSFELDADGATALFIPAGYAHGFVALEDDTLLSYKVDMPYHPESEVCYHYSTSGIGADAERRLSGSVQLIISEKDKEGIRLNTDNQ